MDSAHQDAWTYLALANPRTDSLGQSITLTGFQLFVGISAGLLTIGNTLTTTAPTGSGIGAPTISVDEDSIAAGLAIAFTPTPVDPSTALIVFTSPPVSVGTRFNGDYRFLKAIAAAGTSPDDISAELTTKWGTTVAGQRYFIRCKIIATAGANKGWTSPSSNIIMLDTAA